VQTNHTCYSTVLRVNSELGSKIENHEVSPGKRGPATQEGGPCGQAYGGKWGHGRGESGKTKES
jgi:hypothetical protein